MVVILKSLVAAKKPVTFEFQRRISNSAFLGLDAVPLTDTVAKMPAVRLNTVTVELRSFHNQIIPFQNILNAWRSVNRRLSCARVSSAVLHVENNHSTRNRRV
jgi:hypothetical protein